VTGSAGASYLWRIPAQWRPAVRIGLRASLTLPDGSVIPNGTHLPYYTQVNTGVSHVFHLTGAGTLTARVDVINLFDRQYQIRNGTGVGVGAPQFGPRAATSSACRSHFKLANRNITNERPASERRLRSPVLTH